MDTTFTLAPSPHIATVLTIPIMLLFCSQLIVHTAEAMASPRESDHSQQQQVNQPQALSSQSIVLDPMSLPPGILLPIGHVSGVGSLAEADGAPQVSVHGQPQPVNQPQPPSSGSQSVILDPTALPPGILLPVGHVGGVGGIRRNRAGWREWRRADPTLINSLWKSKMGHGIRSQLGNAEVYIILALLIGLVTVVIGCWLSDNCWSPEPEHVVTIA